ncbi:MAG: ATP-binding protein, partial [Acidimicrobiales bacterium]
TEKAAQVRAQLAALPAPADVGPLSLALERARAKLDAARVTPTQLAESHATAKALDAAAARLGLGALASEAIESLQVPSASDVDAERSRRQRHQLATERLDDELSQLGAEMAGYDSQLEELATEAPDPSRAHDTREHRDAGWQAVRATVEGRPADPDWARGRPLLDAYEDAVTQADDAADERYDHADAIAKIEQLHALRADAETHTGELRTRTRELAESNAVASSEWADRWSRIGVEPGAPDAMSQWLSDQRELVADIGRWRLEGARIAVVSAEVERHAADLRAALEVLGVTPFGDLDAVVERAAQSVDAGRGDAESRRLLDAELSAAVHEVPKRESDLVSRRHAMEEWLGSWTAALQPVGMAASTSAEAGLVAVAGHRELAAARRAAKTLERRITGIERDCRTYETLVAKICASFGIDGRTPLGAVSELERRLREAQKAQQRRSGFEENLAEAERAVDVASSEMDATARALVAWRVEAALPVADAEPDVGMDDHVARANATATLRAQLADVEAAIVEQDGAQGLDQLEAEVLAARDVMEGELAVLAEDGRARQQELEAANQQLADAKKAFAEVSDDATAADHEQDAEADFAVACALVSEYARTALAAEILRRAIAEYGDRHRGPLLDRATELFGLMTDGAFGELVAAPEGERQVLLARRQSGEHCRVIDLSDGTRDQLYLSLRLAGLEHQLSASSEPLPVVLDDVLVHYDDRRAAAAIRALRELGQRAQVLLFTHHTHVVETVERELGAATSSVVRLEPRRHDGAPPTNGAATERLLAALEESDGQGLGKAELMARSGVSESQWPTAIRALVRRGSVVQEGEKRGARYRPAPTIPLV